MAGTTSRKLNLMNENRVPLNALQVLRHNNDERTLAWSSAPPEEVSILFWGIEFAGEAGELCNKLKKLERELLGWKGSRTNMEEIKHEIGDVMICLDHIASALKLDLYECTKLAFNSKSEEMGFPQLLP